MNSIIDKIKKVLFHSEKYSKRLFGAGVWMGSLRISNRALSLIKTIILARLLEPKDFGIFGVALIVLSAMTLLTQPGIDQALIQKKEEILNYLDTAWTVKFLRGIFNGILLFLLSPYIANFFSEPSAVNIIRIMSFTFIIGAFGNQGVVYFIKDMKFHKQFIYEFSCTFFDLIVSIILAIILHSPLALAFGYISGILAMCITSYYIHPYRPKFTLEFSKFKELLKYSKWIWGDYALNLILSEGVSAFVGKTLGTISLGIFQISLKITNSLTFEFSNILSFISFPFYSEVQENTAKLKDLYGKILKLTSFIVIPVAIMLFVFSKIITIAILGDKWIECISIIRFLALGGILSALIMINSSFFKAIGKPDFNVKMQIFRLLILCILIYPLLITYGLMGVVIASLICKLLTLPIELKIISKKLDFSMIKIIKLIVVPTIICLVTIIVVIIINKYLPFNSNEISLAVIVLLNVIVYLSLFYLLDSFLNYGIKNYIDFDLIKNLIKSEN